MLPGWIAGHYAIDECVIPLPPLAQRAGIAFHQAFANAIDLERRIVRCADGSEHPYDVLSIDTGPVADLDRLPGARQHALAVRPIESFIEGWMAMRDRIRTRRGGRIAMIGAGAAGVELALAMRYALRDLPATTMTLVSAEDTLPGSTGVRLERLLRGAGVDILPGTAAERIESGRVVLSGDRVLQADAIVVSTGTAAAAWLQRSGLAIDERGFLLTDATMRVVSHPEVFAAGDCASVGRHPRPKSGVYAVRAGPPLARNLRCALEGRPLANWVPQENSLYLVSSGRKHAVGSWGSFSWEGDWVWRWKDRIDRSFVAKYAASAGTTGDG
jgi:selenide,water dikinase